MKSAYTKDDVHAILNLIVETMDGKPLVKDFPGVPRLVDDQSFCLGYVTALGEVRAYALTLRHRLEEGTL